MKVAKRVVSPVTSARFFSVFFDVIEGNTKRAELNVELDGKRYVLIAYHLNEQIPVRVDLKIKR